MTGHKLITAGQLREKFGGITKMTLHRWMNDPKAGFPTPLKIQNRNYWHDSDIEAFLRLKETAKGSAPDTGNEAAT